MGLSRLTFFQRRFLHPLNKYFFTNHLRNHDIKLKFSRTQFRSCSQMARGNRVLNVAEKNDAAKSLSDLMSNGRFRRREGFSRYNKIYEYDYQLFNRQCSMTMTSVSGHLLNYEFVAAYKRWNSCDPVALFDAKMHKSCLEDYVDIKRTLEREARQADILVIWTDCDREGENIGFEVIDTCKAVKPNLEVYRARFSEITPRSVARACNNLVAPDALMSAAVDVRQQLDLRIGAAFTRFQTLRLQKVFPEVLAQQLISFGSCQFPTLGFVVERFNQVEAFIPEPFYKIKVRHTNDDATIDFNWKRYRLFDRLLCEVLLQICQENPLATVTNVKSKSKSKWRPKPMDTVELEKLSSRKLRISAKETMKIAEKLYTQGFISYPRTETTIFPKDLNLVDLVQNQTQDPNWGAFAAGILQDGGPTPRQGNKTDQAHPPIHPTKYSNNLQGNEAKVYELVVRHFLACCSKDAQGQETTVDIKIACEYFSASGLMIIARNYLDVYIYEKWNARVIPVYQMGQTFEPTSITLGEGETSPPSLLTEADLIALMEKHGIGTDATHADHIETVKSRLYVGVRPDGRFVPGELGMGLVEGYDNMGYELSKPNLRAELEADLKRICDGKKNADVVLTQQVAKYKEVFIEAVRKANMLDTALAGYFNQQPQNFTPEAVIPAATPVRQCPRCQESMVAKQKREGGWMISCMGFPACKNAIWMPANVLHIDVLDETCQQCSAGQPGPVHKLKFKFKKGSVPPMIPEEYVGCVGGCDANLKEAIDLNLSYLRPASQQSNSTGASYRSNSNSFNNTAPRNATGNANRGGTRRGGANRGGAGRGGAGRGQGGGRGSGSGGGNGPGGGGGFNTGPGRGFGPAANQNKQPPGQLPSRASNFSGGGNTATAGGSGDNAVVCNCGGNAILLTVRKEGANQGRQFYKCNGGNCDFFLWADENKDSETRPSSGFNTFGRTSTNNQAPSSSTVSSGYGSGSGDGSPQTNNWGEVMCQCRQAAAKRTVSKDGPNKGRQFYCCGKPQGSQCKFFEWCDGDGGGGGGGGGGSGGGGGGGQGSWASNNRGGGGGSYQNRGKGQSRGGGRQDGAKKRKSPTCSICNQEGHTKRTCPMK